MTELNQLVVAYYERKNLSESVMGKSRGVAADGAQQRDCQTMAVGSAAMATEQPDGDTKSRILAAALAEFAAKGIAGARVDAIAKRAGANIQSIYYYFESKDELFREILRRFATSLDLEREWQWLEPANLQFMEGEEGRRVYYESAPARNVRLLMWEALEYGEGQSFEEEGPRHARQQQRIDRIRRQQRLGQLPPEFDPAQLLLLEMALIVFPLAFPQQARFTTGMNPTDPEFVAARNQFLRDLTNRLSGSDGTENKPRRNRNRRKG